MDEFKEIKFAEPFQMEPNKPTTIELKDITNLFKTVSVVPTHVPRRFEEQIIFYVSGATKRLYIYDTNANAWLYSTLT